MPRVPASDIHLNYEEYGSGPEPLVLVHGWTGTLNNWHAVVPQLPLDRLHVYAFDLRGAGESDRPASGYEAQQLADDIAEATANLGIDSFHFAGHSLGGVIGMHLALRHPARLRRLMLVEPAPSEGILSIDPEEQFYKAMSSVYDDAQKHKDFVIQALSVRPVSPELMAVVLAEKPCSPEHVDLVWQGLKQDISGDLSRIKADTLMIAADRDLVGPSNLRDAARIPNCALQVFYRVGHMVAWEVPDQLAALMDDFIKNGAAVRQEA